MRKRLHLAWLALTGQLSGGVYFAPLNDKAKVTIEYCAIEQRVGRVPVITMAPNWPTRAALEGTENNATRVGPSGESDDAGTEEHPTADPDAQRGSTPPEKRNAASVPRAALEGTDQ